MVPWISLTISSISESAPSAFEWFLILHFLMTFWLHLHLPCCLMSLAFCTILCLHSSILAYSSFKCLILSAIWFTLISLGITSLDLSSTRILFINTLICYCCWVSFDLLDDSGGGCTVMSSSVKAVFEKIKGGFSGFKRTCSRCTSICLSFCF